MSTDSSNDNDDIGRLEISIFDNIEYYKYSDFNNIQEIGNGAFGRIFRANWKTADTCFALKSFNNVNNVEMTLKGIEKELQLHHSIVHKNIIRLYGITKEIDAVYYTLVLEYADSGTLNDYLSKHFNELDWNDKSCLALQLASAVEFLHEKNIIHRDLHANNILVHKKDIKIADFGLSKKIGEKSSNPPKIFGVLPYMDPQSINKQNYRLDEKSDVYSVGVLMWQISSGRQPFYRELKRSDYDAVKLTLDILGEKREKIIDGTPIGYSNLYKKCWKHEPNERPNMQDVVSIFKTITSITDQSDQSVDKVDEENYSNSSLDINKMPNISLYENVEYKGTNSLGSVNNLFIATGSTNPQANSLERAFDEINNTIASEIIKIIIKKHDQGITFDQIKQLISQLIMEFNQNTDKFVEWLSKNQVKAEYIWLLGLLYYYYDIDTKEKTFELFSNAATENYPIAQVYLAKCYQDGYGTECNKELAFDLYEKSVKNESIIGQFYLGYCYEYGIGIEKDDEKSAQWYEKAVNHGNIIAKLCLAECYKLGKGVKKNETKAFKYYKILAEREIADAQDQLGNCFYYGIGTKVDKDLALAWYTKAAKNGNIIARDILKKNYNKKIKIEKTKKIKLFKLLFSKSLSQLGTYYVGKILLKTNYERSFYYFQKAAENGYKVAQFNLGNQYRVGERIKKDERKAFELFAKSAEQGYVDGKFRLGYCYSIGIGTDINKAKAIELYKIAAKEENGGAQNNLGLLYKNGDGIEKDLEKAIYWFDKAAKNGNEVAQYNLGLCYELGIGVKQDEVKAFKLYKKSAEKNYQDGKFLLGNCYNEGIGTKVSKEKAFILFQVIAKEGNKVAQNSLGILYELGEGTKRNLEMAFYWYNKAANNGNEVAQYNLGLCYEFEKGVKKDEVKAFELYKKSAKQGYLKAQERVARCYDMGVGTPVNKEKASELIKEAKEGNKFAQSNELAGMAFY